MIPLLITKKQANDMFELVTPRPKGTFIYTKDGLWNGIDNRNGNMVTKTFSTINGCMKWLKGNSNL